MKTNTYNLCPDGTNEKTSTTINVYFFTTCDWHIAIKKAACKNTLTEQQIADGVKAYLTLGFSVNGQTTTQTVEIDREGKYYYDFDVSVDVPAFTNVGVVTTTTNCALYNAENTGSPVSMFLAGGWTSGGQGTTLQSGYWADMVFEISYDEQFVVDSQNDGYARLAALDAIDFVFFEKDEDGYPINRGAWKLDTQNDGYPWIWGFNDFIPRGGVVYIRTAEGLVPYKEYFVTENGLELLTAYLMTENGLEKLGG